MGPKIWKKPISFHKLAGGNELGEGAIGGLGNNGGMDVSGSEFSVMNIEEFLNENNFDFERFSPPVAEDEKGKSIERAAPLINRDAYR